MGKKNYTIVDSINKSFIRAILVIIILFIVVAFFSMNIIDYLFYDDIKKSSIDIADKYANELSISKVALDVIDDLIDKRFELTVELVNNYSQEPTTDLLIDIANKYEIREINIFNQDGEIYSSNMSRLIGWQMEPDHPAYDFFKKSKPEETFVEDIRKDLESDIQTKYVYYKDKDGDLIQIGIAAEEYYNLIKHFQVQQTLVELNEFSQVMGAQYIDNSLNIVVQESQYENYKFKLDGPKIYAISQSEQYYSRTECCGEDIYEVLTPVFDDNGRVGTLAISYIISDVLEVLRWIYIAGMSILIIIFLLVARGIDKIRQKNKKLIDLAYYDQLTGLPNLDYLMEFSKDRICDKSGQEILKNKAIILIDIVNVNLILLTHGYDQAENILKEIASQLCNLLTDNEKLFRIAESQFLIYVEHYRDKEYLIDISNKITSYFKSYIKDSNITNHVTAKIGINDIGDCSEGVLNIIKNAQIAANTSNANNREYEFFDNILEQDITRKNYIENEIKRFIKEENTNIYLDYQPQLDLRANKISGLEGLARMKTDKYGQVSPLEFIAIAEESNLIIELGLILFRKACGFLSELSQEGFSNLTVAVNVSTIQVLRDDFYDNIIKILKETNINTNNLEIEITESEFLDNFDIVNTNLSKLINMGISVAIDDFGTGYSSLERLKRLNVHRLKVDKTFIDRITISKPEKLITGDIISLAHKIGLETVAEGVELQEQKDYLVDNGCDIMQGYLFSKPVSREKALEMLRDGL